MPVRSHSSSWKRGELAVRGVERVRIRVADARHDVPVVARPAGQLERRAWGDDVEPLLRVEHVGEAEQVVLVGPAAVMEDEQAGGVSVGRPLTMDEPAHARTLVPRVGQRRQRPLEHGAQVLVLGGQAQLLAEVLGVLVDGEPGRARRDLEQDPLRLAEVDRVEVVAVDHGRDVHAGLGGALLPARRGPRRASARRCGARSRRPGARARRAARRTPSGSGARRPRGGTRRRRRREAERPVSRSASASSARR